MTFQNFTTLAVFVLFGFSLSGQSIHDEGDAISTHQIINIDDPESIPANLKIIRAGDDIEGDYHIAPEFEPTGSRCWVLHRTTDNISVIDFSTFAIHKVIDVGAFPMDIAFTDQYAIVSCYESQEIYIYNWHDYSMVSIIPTFGRPAGVEVSADGKYAVVSLEEIDNALVINLDNFSITSIDEFPTFIFRLSFITSNPRNQIQWNGFAVSPDGSQVVNGSSGALKFYDHTNTTVDSIPEIQNASQVKYSLDGTILIAITFGSAASIYQVDPITKQIIKVLTPSVNVNSFYEELAISNDGQAVFLPSTNSGVHLRFDTEEITVVNTTGAVFWTAITSDGKTAIAGGYYLSTIDMEDGSIISTSSGISLSHGAISPNGEYLIAGDPLRRERMEMYLNTPNGLFPAGQIIPGSPLEADASYSVTITPDQERAIVVNNLSGTLTIVDLNAQQVEKIIPLDWYEIFHVSVTPDSKFAFVAERLGNQVSIIDLGTLEVVAVMPSGGTKPDQIFITPDGSKAFVSNAAGTDALGVITINGASSTLTGSFPSGNVGVSWTNFGIRCNLAITPSGQYGVIAAPFDDQVNIIDINGERILSSHDIEGFPLQTALSEPIDGRIYSATTLKNSGEIFVMEDIGHDAIPFGSLDVGKNPTRIAYDPSTKTFVVTIQDENKIVFVDPTTFSIVDQIALNEYAPISILINKNGDRYTLANGPLGQKLFINESSDIALPSLATHHFDISEDGNTVALTSPSQDELYLITDALTSNRNLVKINLDPTFVISPNPASDFVRISRIKDTALPNLTISIFNAMGQDVNVHELNNNQTNKISLRNLPSGVYPYIIQSNGHGVQTGSVVIK